MAVVLEVEWVILSHHFGWKPCVHHGCFSLLKFYKRHHVVKFPELEHETPSFSI